MVVRVCVLLQHAPCNVQHATCSVQRADCNMHRAVCNVQHATCNMQHAACNVQHATCRFLRVLPADGPQEHIGAGGGGEALMADICFSGTESALAFAAASARRTSAIMMSYNRSTAVAGCTTGVCCMLHVACCMLNDAWCMLYVACCKRAADQREAVVQHQLGVGQRPICTRDSPAAFAPAAAVPCAAVPCPLPHGPALPFPFAAPSCACVRACVRA
jgi:hypothetical protein